ncbi:MAG: RNA 3'-phosphate cyclase [Thermoprotei archaeon]|nr:MAG: RNA 3'-phosphate cyclase [Thermoprotei archaeon]
MTLIIDGSMGEGGGQILRTAIALSAVLQKPVKVINIRAKRKNPGLQRQHLTAVRIVAQLTKAKVDGNYLGSTALYFEPRGFYPGRYRFDVGTAGSVTLVLQCVLPVLAFMPEPVELEIIGGTDVPWSPTIDYMKFVVLPFLNKLGFKVEVRLIRRGHYPRGGGIVRVRTSEPPRELKPLRLVERGKVIKIQGHSHAVRLPKHVAERQARAAKARLKEHGIDTPIEISIEYYEPGKDPHLGPGSGIALWAITEYSILGSDALGARGKPAEVVGEEAANKLITELDAGMCLDKHMGDIIIPYLVLANGRSEITVTAMTMHAYTMIELAKIMTKAKLNVINGGLEKPFKLTVEGIGLKTK